jgi:hypothetical protein
MWMMDMDMYARATEWGYPGTAFYVLGRFGVLGEASTETVLSTGFFGDGFVRAAWEGPRPEPMTQTLERFCSECAAAGRRVFDQRLSEDDTARLAALCFQLADGVDSPGLPLFEGWRRVARPTAPVDAASIALNVVRELRGAIHLAAVATTGITAAQAVVSSDGQGMASFFGHPDLGQLPDHVAPALAAAEELTDRGMAVHIGRLSETERSDLASLVSKLPAD